MKRLKRHSTTSPTPARLTLYVRPEHQELIQWVQQYSQAKSLSEAVFSVLNELRAVVEEKQLQALEETHGIWKDDPKIAQAFKELEEGWRRWRKQLESS